MTFNGWRVEVIRDLKLQRRADRTARWQRTSERTAFRKRVAPRGEHRPAPSPSSPAVSVVMRDGSHQLALSPALRSIVAAVNQLSSWRWERT